MTDPTNNGGGLDLRPYNHLTDVDKHISLFLQLEALKDRQRKAREFQAELDAQATKEVKP